MTQTTSPQPNFWTRLLEPHSSVRNTAARRRARVLAGISLILVLTVGALFVWSIVTATPRSGAILVGLGVIAAAYALGRTPLAAWGARLLVFGLTALMLYFIFTAADGTALLISTPFLILPVLLATLLLDARLASLVAGTAILAVVLTLFIVPQVNFAQFVGPFAVVVIISILAAVTSFLRERDITTIETQAEELSQYSKSLEAEARNIVATAQVGQAITATRDLDQLLKQVVDLIVERFSEVYHAQVFLIDDEQQAVLRESSGEAGKQLLARNHRLGVGSQSVIGRVTDKAQPVVVSDTDLDPTHRRNELLPNTRSEMALPLIAVGRVIGALDIQSTTANAFRESDVRVFQTMADQLAIAIENARLFQRAQRDLEEIELLNRRLTGEGWSNYQRSRGMVAGGYEATASGVRPLPSGLEQDGQPAGDATLRMPLMVRGEAVGVLDVKSRSGESPSAEVQAILEAVAERVALALDSTRLSESALRQAEREQVLGHISAELQATTDLDVILRVAAREASRAMGTSRGFVHLIMEYGGEHSEAAEQG
jgi:GAF domain-containing protein